MGLGVCTTPIGESVIMIDCYDVCVCIVEDVL